MGDAGHLDGARVHKRQYTVAVLPLNVKHRAYDGDKITRLE